MNHQTIKERERNLRDIFRTMDAHRAQKIREAYYKAVEGLIALAESLKIEDAETGSLPDFTFKELPLIEDYPLIEEHMIACRAINAMKASLLGRIL